jgi:hippurate hydrolase
MHAGTASNVIPDVVTMGGTLRTFDEKTRDYIKERMTQIAEGIATSFRAHAEVTFGNGCPTLNNDGDLSGCVATYMRDLLGEGKAYTVEQLSAVSGDGTAGTAGSEDFAYVSQKVPALMLALAAGQPQAGYCYPQHHPMVKFDEDVLAGGSAVYAYSAMRWLEEHKK